MDYLKNDAFFILPTLCSLCFSAILCVFYLLLSVFYLEKFSSFLFYFYYMMFFPAFRPPQREQPPGSSSPPVSAGICFIIAPPFLPRYHLLICHRANSLSPALCTYYGADLFLDKGSDKSLFYRHEQRGHEKTGAHAPQKKDF